MKKKVVLTIVMVWLLVVGCDEDFDQADYDQALAEVQAVSEQVDSFQGDVSAALAYFEALADANTAELPFGIDRADYEQGKQQIAAVDSEIDRVQAQLGDIIAALQANPPTVRTGSAVETVRTVADTVSTAAPATAPWNPYAAAITGIASLVSVICGAWARQEKNKATANAKKYQAHKQALELVKAKHPDLTAEAYETVGAERAKLGVH
jgi:outer membrane murein-binding lipoprotein Lpp